MHNPEMGFLPDNSSKKIELEKEEMPNIENIGKRKSKFGDYYVSDTERLIIGERIPDTERKAFTNKEQTSNWESGSIGFLDFVHEGKEIVVNLIGVEPEHEKKGYGKGLIKKIENIARERKVEEIKFSCVMNDKLDKLLTKSGYFPLKKDIYSSEDAYLSYTKKIK